VDILLSQRQLTKANPQGKEERKDDMSMDNKSLRQIEHECGRSSHLGAPENERQIFYRLPFSYLKTHEERERDAWLSIQIVLEQARASLSEPYSLMREKDAPGKSFPPNHREYSFHNGLIMKAASDWSDLWIRFNRGDAVHEQSIRGALEILDKIMLSLSRPVYRYVKTGTGFNVCPNRNHEWEEQTRAFLGVDAGSISINTAIVDEDGVILETDYTLTEGDVFNNIKKSLANISTRLPSNLKILGAGVTGSGHEIAMAVLDADVYETELDAHAEAAIHMVPGARVVFDIGGQDSKVMYIENGFLDEAGMNKKCGAGTGAFLDAQAARLGIPIEKFGEVSLSAQKPYSFSCMCTVFVGRDLISEQAKGNTKENIIAGLHKSLAMNFFSTLGIDKKRLKTPIVFQGGVAANIGVKRALEECLSEARGEKCEIIVPMRHNVMGAIGMALIARKQATLGTKFRGFELSARIFSLFEECDLHGKVGCKKERICDLVKLFIGNERVHTLYACKEYFPILENTESEEQQWTDRRLAGSAPIHP
jgi:predicted CoA-substrate-specific enzyme activase